VPTRRNSKAIHVFRQHNVIVVLFPPHLMHVMQPVDVSWAKGVQGQDGGGLAALLQGTVCCAGSLDGIAREPRPGVSEASGASVHGLLDLPSSCGCHQSVQCSPRVQPCGAASLGFGEASAVAAH
jgi:hypothetical protein